MRNIQIILEYDGTHYVGWQKQKNGISIQEILEKKLSGILSSDIKIVGSGRTDSGVHAYGQSANFTTDSTIPVERFPFAINAQLPKDIRVTDAYERGLNFHSRFDAKCKEYEYKILCNAHGSALNRNRVWHIKKKLNTNKMKQTLPFFVGTKDFTTFSSVHSGSVNKVRTIYTFEMTCFGDEIVFTIKGNGFLYNMVRIIIGTIIEVGLTNMDIEEIPKLFEYKDRRRAGKTAPAQGLYLKEVLY